MATDSPQHPTLKQEIRLIEYVPLRISAEMLSEMDAAKIWERHHTQVHVEFPSRKTAGEWELTNTGWLGVIPVSNAVTLRLLPSLPIADIFGMLEYAYQLQSFHILRGIATTEPVEQAYEHLAVLLARMVLDLCRKGIYRGYTTHHDRTEAVRGRIDLHTLQPTPIDPRLTCTYQEQTADVPENRYIAVTLARILRSHLCTERTLPTIRQAYRLLSQQVTVPASTQWHEPAMNYHRLNAHYRPLHALCRFFLDNQGPGYEAGTETSLPFLLSLPRLFERFVAEWCQVHCPATHRLQRQQQLVFTGQRDIRFIADLVLYQSNADVPIAVLDTKYRINEHPSTADIAQVVAYAEAIGCHHALLVYPYSLAVPLVVTIGDVQVHSVTFNLSQDIAIAGAAMLAQWQTIDLLR